MPFLGENITLSCLDICAWRFTKWAIYEKWQDILIKVKHDTPHWGLDYWFQNFDSIFTFLNIAKIWLKKIKLVLSDHDFWPTWKRYSYVPLWVSGHLDLTMDFPTCHYSWLFRKTFWNGIWMLVFSLSPLKLRCPTMTTMRLKKRYRF